MSDPSRLDVEELREVLDRLSAIEGDLKKLDLDEGHQILAVAEALDLPEWQIHEVLKAVREDRAARALREIEEPLYRVERPGHAPVDRLARTDIGAHVNTIRSILDKVPHEGEISRRPKRDLRVSNAETFAHRVILWTLTLTIAAGALAGIKAIFGF